ncbi:MAG: NUMOD3 domain-containing DNA-binding protein [Nanoarchaeota archaeon]
MSKIKRSLDWRVKQSISHSGRNNYLYGKTYEDFWGKDKADDIKRKKSIASKGRVISEKSRKKMSITRKNLMKSGKIKPPRVSLKGEKNPMYGRKRPDLVLRNKLITRKGIRRPNHSDFMKHWHKNHSHPMLGKPNYKLRLLNKDPEFLKKAMLSKFIRPNVPEKTFINLIEKNSLPFQYVGDGSYLVGNKNPDFISNDNKQIVEIFGDYYHDENRRKLPYSRTYNGTKKYYEEKGYKILIIWEKELKDIESVLNKTRKFIGEFR